MFLMTRHGVWTGNWTYYTPETVTTTNYTAIAISHILQFTTARTKFSVCCILTSRCLVTAPNVIYFSTPMFTSLSATDCLIAPHGRNSCPLALIRVWTPLATTNYRTLALTSGLELVCLVCLTFSFGSRYMVSTMTQEITPAPVVPLLLGVYHLPRSCYLVTMETYLQSHYLTTDVFSGFAILVLSGHVIVRT
jgi:hypothetical protein